MNTELIIQDSESGLLHEISELTTTIKWETTLLEQPSKFSFSFLNHENIPLSNGSTVAFKIDDNKVFFGNVFKKQHKEDGIINVTAFDMLRYLKYKDTYVFSGLTAPQIFSKICKEQKLKHTIIDNNNYIVPPKPHDGKTLFEIIQYGIDQTLINTGNWFMIRDNFGTLEFIAVNSLKTDLFIGDNSLLLKYDYEISIDDDTYNQVILNKENSETNRRERYIVKDSDNIKRWGILQYFETVDEEINPAQIKQRAEMILKLKNRETKKLKIDCLGDLKCRAGNGIVLGISDLKNYGVDIDKYFIITSASHTFEKDSHTMKLELQVSI